MTTVPTQIKPSVVAAVGTQMGAQAPVPKGLRVGNTNDEAPQFFHGCIYAGTGEYKTTTAAQFGSPEEVRIVLTRRKEQLIPLKGLGYKYAEVSDAASLKYALLYPERLWPEWSPLPNRTLVLDDATEAVAMLLDDNSVIDGREVKDVRRTYSSAGNDLRVLVSPTLRKPMHFVMTALAKVRENPLTNEERIGPDLPPSMLNFMLTEMEFVLYVDYKTKTLLTDKKVFSFDDTDEKGYKKTYVREIFAKHKLPRSLVGKGILKPQEPLDLRAIWNKVLEAKVSSS